MIKISAIAIKALRDKTGVAMMACKKALEESAGDEKIAIDLLRKRGEVKAGEKSKRSTSEGLIIASDRFILKLLCETDFVARNDDFISLSKELILKAKNEGIKSCQSYFDSIKSDKIQAIGENLVLEEITCIEGGDNINNYVHSNGKLAAIVTLEGGDLEQARDVAMHVVAMDPLVCFSSEVSDELIEKEKEIAREQLKNEGKPAQIIEKILEGKMKKFYSERVLEKQSFVKEPSKTIKEYLDKAKLIGFIRMSV